MRTFFLLLFLLLICLAGKPQSFVFAGGHYGRMLKINAVWPDVLHNATIFTAGFSTRVSGNKIWHRQYHFPETGLRFMFFSPGNREVFGRAFSLTPTLSFPIASASNFQLRFNLGYSPGIITRSYNRQSNPTNNVIGSPLNYFILFQLESRWTISDHWQLALGADYSHFSNGRSKIPNLGLNIPAISLNARYKIRESISPTTFSEENQPVKKFNRIHPGIKAGYGFNSQKSPGGPLYPVYVGAFTLNTLWKNKIRLKVGTEWFFAESIYAFIQNQDIPFDNPRRAATGGVVFAGGEFLFGRAAFVAHIGPYIKRPYQMNYVLYTKFGPQFYFYEQQKKPFFQPFLGVYVHAHSGEADFAEFAVGFVF
ncbi:MAG: acyloxyacyl hydrolase [Bacteroidia bacterium]|nr:acyloxyacyl hydrolase [Bacteroidia bacterium]